MFLYENSGEILHKNYPVHPVNPCRSAPHECVFGYRKVQQGGECLCSLAYSLSHLDYYKKRGQISSRGISGKN